MDVRFTADRSLGKLAKWLRILGYDTVYDRGNADGAFLRRAAEEGRVALTRRRAPDRRSQPGNLLVVRSDRVEGQLREVIDALGLKPDSEKRLTRCLRCNVPLEEAPKAAVTGLVPVYVSETCTQFHLCRRCGRVYWPGTHPRRVEEYLRTRVHPC